MVDSSNIDIIIPTLNSEKVLEKCLRSIRHQQYSQSKIHVYICDGGSTDKTLKIGKKYGCRLLNNPLKTAEAGKAVGLKNSHSPFVALIDSDNILPNTHWLIKMLQPFIDSQIISSEPISFTYRPHAGYIERYSALIGANDPYAYVSGNYDRYSYLSQKWTGLHLSTTDHSTYLKIRIDDNQHLPTIGANGTIFRRSFLEKFFSGEYLFDIDILAIAPKPLYIAKVKIGIIHTFCESSLSKFINKQRRRLTDYYHYQEFRRYYWQTSTQIPRFVVYSLFLFPSVIDSFRGYIKKPDSAWFFHPLACFLSLWIYFFVYSSHYLHLLAPLNRQQWRQ